MPKLPLPLPDAPVTVSQEAFEVAVHGHGTGAITLTVFGLPVLVRFTAFVERLWLHGVSWRAAEAEPVPSRVEAESITVCGAVITAGAV